MPLLNHLLENRPGSISGEGRPSTNAVADVGVNICHYW